MADKKLFDRTINATPPTDLRVAFGKSGLLTLNMTFSELFVYLKANVSYDDLYLNKGNTAPYTPTLDYHPATKKYVDDNAFSIGGVVDNPNGKGWTQMTGNMRLQWFKFTSTTDDDQVVPLPYPFPNACVNVSMGNQAFNIVSLTANSITVNRWNEVDGSPVIYVQAIGY